jgi:hypothetical protein
MASSLLMPAIAMIAGTTLLSLQIYIMTRINHGATRSPRRSRKLSDNGARGSIRYSVGAAPSRILSGDDSYDRSIQAAGRLVDSGGMRRLPRDHARYLDGVRHAGTGPRPGAYVRALPGVASPDRQELGGVTPPSRQVASILPSTAPVL